MAMTGEMGYPSVLTAPDLGLLRRAVQGQAVQVPAPLRQLRDGERAVQDLLPGRVPRADRGRMRDARCTRRCKRPPRRHREDRPSAPTSRRSASSTRQGPLDNPADRDHCIQYMVAVPLIFGRLTAGDYEDAVAADPRIDALRDKMVCVEDPQFTQRLPRPGQALHRQRAHRGVQRRQQARGSRRRIPDRPPPPAQGRHAAAGGEVQDQPRAPLPGEAAAGDPGPSRSTRRRSRRCRSTNSST